MRAGPLTGDRTTGSRGARSWIVAVAIAVAAIVGAVAWSLGPPPSPSPVAEQPAPPSVQVTQARLGAPFREYPTVAPDEIWPERPPFAIVRGFPPPPKPPPLVSTGPVRRFGLPRFEVDSAIEVLSITPANELPTPSDASYRVGWYTDFGQPGQGGNAVFSAHETWNHYQAPFFNLSKMEVRDEVVIDMADGRKLVYAVISNVRYEVNSIPMDAILWPPLRGADEWITLITCGGRIVYDERTGFGEYLDRDVVVARRVR